MAWLEHFWTNRSLLFFVWAWLEWQLLFSCLCDILCIYNTYTETHWYTCIKHYISNVYRIKGCIAQHHGDLYTSIEFVIKNKNQDSATPQKNRWRLGNSRCSWLPQKQCNYPTGSDVKKNLHFHFFGTFHTARDLSLIIIDDGGKVIWNLYKTSDDTISTADHRNRKINC